MGNMFGWGQQGAQKVSQGIDNLGNNVANGVNTMYQNAQQGWNNFRTNTWPNMGTNLAAGALDTMNNAINAVDKAKQGIQNAGRAVATGFQRAGQGIANTAGKVVGKFRKAGQGFVQDFKQGQQEAQQPGSFKNAMNNTVTKVKTGAQKVGSTIKTGVQKAAPVVKNVGSTLANAGKGFASGFKQSFQANKK